MKSLKRKCCMVGMSAVMSMSVLSGCGKSSPSAQVEKAFEQFSEEMDYYSGLITDELELDDLYDYMEDNPVHMYLDMSMTDPDGDDAGNFSVTLDAISDIPNKALDADVELGTYGVSLSLGNIIFSDGTVYIASDKFLGTDVYRIDTTNFTEDFNSSGWSNFLGTTIDDDYVESVTDASSIDLDSFKELNEKLRQDLKANESYASIKEQKVFNLDGKETKCSGVEVTVDKDAAKEAFDNYVDGLVGIIKSDEAGDLREYLEDAKDIELYDNLVYDIYIDSKGRLVNISTPQDIEIDSETISFDINFTGTDRRTDVIEGEIYVKENDSIIRIGITRNAEVSDSEYNEDLEIVLENDDSDDKIAITFANNWDREDLSFEFALSMLENDSEELGVYADGSFDDVVKGEACTFDIKNAKFVSEGENSLIVSGKLTIEPTDSVVEVPESSIDLLGMSEDDITSLLYGMIVKFSQIGIY